MKPEERHAEQYLKHLDIGSVEYEPIKNETPDFLVDGRIAVEVRRLNENYVGGAPGMGHEGLDEKGKPIEAQMRALLESFGPPTGKSAVVGYRFKRPLNWKKRAPKIRALLEEFRANRPTHAVHAEIDASFSVTIQPVSMRLPAEFRLHVIVDEDSGGMLVELMEKNLEIAISEKERKVAKNWHLYPEWWLVLVDAIGLGVGEPEWTRVRDSFTTKHSFARIVILNPSDPTIAFEL